MKKSTILAVLLFLFLPSLKTAATDNYANMVLDNVIKMYKAAKGISVKYILTSGQGQASGNIVMQGQQFRMLSNDLKCWYNGTTQWSYTSISGEVNITKPSAEELQLVNPYAIISGFKNAYTARRLNTSTTSHHDLLLTPKSKTNAEISAIGLTISRRMYLPTKIVITLRDKSYLIVTLSHYKTGQNFPASTFTFDKSLVPSSAQVVDLR